VIPRDHILEWRARAPWPQDIQVEQDLVISRALVEIFSNPGLHDALGCRCGTALYKLHLPAARYSERHRPRSEQSGAGGTHDGRAPGRPRSLARQTALQADRGTGHVRLRRASASSSSVDITAVQHRSRNERDRSFWPLPVRQTLLRTGKIAPTANSALCLDLVRLIGATCSRPRRRCDSSCRVTIIRRLQAVSVVHQSSAVGAICHAP
jgi:hypothetical protein